MNILLDQILTKITCKQAKKHVGEDNEYQI
jgi:hypothetical protein